MAKNDKDYVQELEDKISKLEGDVKEKVIENQSTRHSSDGKWVYRSDIMTHRNRLQITLEEFETEQENLNAKLEQNQSRIFGVRGALTSIFALLGEGPNPFDAPDEIQNILTLEKEKKELDGNTIEVDNE
jgi:hypothetical protein